MQTQMPPESKQRTFFSRKNQWPLYKQARHEEKELILAEEKQFGGCTGLNKEVT
jgi:hypothetical protein